MRCQICVTKMTSITTHIPFKTSQTGIVIIKDLPVIQCESCSHYLLEDSVMKRVEEILGNVDTNAELEVIKYAA